MGEDFKSVTDVFLERVENNEPRVYDESPRRNENLIIIMFLGIPILSVYLMALLVGILDTTLLVLIIVIMGIFVTASALIIVVFLMKRSLKAYDRGINSLSRMEVSMLLHILDLFYHGHQRNGTIENPNCPVEYYHTNVGSLKECLKNLSRFFNNNPPTWTDKIEQMLESKNAENKIVGALITSFIFLLIWFVLILLSVLDIIPQSFYIHLFVIPIFIMFGLIFVIHYHQERRELPQEVRDYISDSEVIQTLGMIISELLSVIKDESKYPLRFLVIGTYPELKYTGREFRTEYDLVLQEALFIPSISK